MVFLIRQRIKLLGVTTLFALLVFTLTIHDFLAISRPVDGNVLVVEAWILSSPAIREAMEEFERGHYEWLVTVGGPIGEDGESAGQENSAELAARELRELGVDANRVIVLPIVNVTRHRTYASALALKSWLRRSNIETTGVNVFTRGVHARKSLVLFRRALGPGTHVGVIAGTENTYDPDYWWISIRGIHMVLRKTIGYLYAEFWPLPESLPPFSSSGDSSSSRPSQPTDHRQLTEDLGAYLALPN